MWWFRKKTLCLRHNERQRKHTHTHLHTAINCILYLVDALLHTIYLYTYLFSLVLVSLKLYKCVLRIHFFSLFYFTLTFLSPNSCLRCKVGFEENRVKKKENWMKASHSKKKNKHPTSNTDAGGSNSK